MGLDTVTIIVDIENCFNIQIKDEDAEKIRTVGELIDHIWLMVKQEESNSCLNQIVFFRVRKFFSKHKIITSGQFNPSITINQILSKSNKEEVLKELEKELNLSVPSISNYWIIKSESIRFSDTIQDLVNRIIFDNMETLSKEILISKPTVAHTIKYILQEVSEIKIKDIKEEAAIANDLGLS